MNAKFNPSRWIGLSDQQLEVIRWVYEDRGSLELLARAGCGKTFTLMKVIDGIVEGKLGDVAIMAYNKKIADEIKAKLEKTGYDWRVAQAGTVHSFGFGAWRKVAPFVQVENDKLRNILRQEQTNYPEAWILQAAGDVVIKLCSLAKQRAFGHLTDIGDTSAWMDIWDHFGLESDTTEDIDPHDVVEAAKIIYRISLNQCKEVVDFDDMILAPLVFRARFWPKDWILVDESQDTNPARRALALAMLKPKTGRMIFVGDPAQAIYGFTGADSDSMNQLKKATSAKTLPLNVTRRCPKTVVALAARLVPDFVAHEDAPEGVVRDITFEALTTEGLNKNDAILCRNTAPLIQTAYTLIAKGIACRVEGREIGTGLIKLARRWKLKTLDQLLNKLEDYQARQTAKFMSRDQEERVQALVDQVDCLRIVINRCLSLKQTSIDDLVASIESMFGNTKDGEQPPVLTLSTVHKSKGREWQRVYILGRAKYMPSPYAKKAWQIEQESNLEYVAITRAIAELIDVPVSSL
jgi:superfamily I DNA/RNA helicase